MRTLIVLLAVVLGLCAESAVGHAQGVFPFTVEVRGGGAFPTGDLGSATSPGYLAEVTAKYSPLPFVSVYGGYAHAEFAVGRSDALSVIARRIKDSGWRLGGEVGVPLVGLATGIAPYAQAGAIFNRTRIGLAGDQAAEPSRHSDRSIGFEVAGGIRISVTRSFAITPELRYRAHDPEFAGDVEVGPAREIRYLVPGLGVTYHF